MNKNLLISYNQIGDVMRNFFQVVGVLTLVIFSFFFTEKTALVVSEKDELMIKITEIMDKYEKDSIDAKIDGNNMIPGIKGRKVNKGKSYNEMKKLGYFSDSLLIYDDIVPEVSISKNYDKYIVSGNKEKNMVSLVFIVEENDNIDNILRILDRNEVSANFFIEEKWLEKNNDMLVLLKNKGHNLGNLSDNKDYTSSSFIWMDTIIKKVVGQKFSYCYTEIDDDTILNQCSLNKDYTIKPNVILNNNFVMELKKQIQPGSIISLSVNEYLERELNLIINYINSKGYTIETLYNHISE